MTTQERTGKGFLATEDGEFNGNAIEGGPACFDCGEAYASARFPDLVIDDAAFAAIAPKPPDGGLLCPNCLCARLDKAGISCRGEFRSGPLANRMPFDRALKIVGAIINRGFYTIGLAPGAPNSLGSLEGVSLAQMLEAAAVVKAADDTRPPNAEGLRHFHVVPDDRLIAAVYVMEHYEPSNEAIVARPIAHDCYDRIAVVVAGLEPGQGGEDEA